MTDTPAYPPAEVWIWEKGRASTSAYDPKGHGRLRMMLCKLSPEPHFADRKTLL
jgi:hypothetical protein